MPSFQRLTLEKKVAVITGASSGIGRAIALQLAGEGASLCLVGRKPESLEAMAKSVIEQASQVRCYLTDLSLREDIEQLIKSISRDFDRVDLLIHSAGTISWGRLETTPIEELNLQFQVNVYAPYLLTQGLLPKLRLSQGQVVFINSSAGSTNARANSGAYAASKHALKAIADRLRDEVNADGIRVLSVFLGRTASPMQAAVHQHEGRAYHPELLIQPEDISSAVIHSLMMPRTAEVTDIHIKPLIKSY